MGRACGDRMRLWARAMSSDRRSHLETLKVLSLFSATTLFDGALGSRLLPSFGQPGNPSLHGGSKVPFEYWALGFEDTLTRSGGVLGSTGMLVQLHVGRPR